MARTASIIALLAVLLVACSEGFPPEFPAPEFSLTSPGTGRTVTQADIQNKPAILYWFTSW